MIIMDKKGLNLNGLLAAVFEDEFNSSKMSINDNISNLNNDDSTRSYFKNCFNKYDNQECNDIDKNQSDDTNDMEKSNTNVSLNDDETDNNDNDNEDINEIDETNDEKLTYYIKKVKRASKDKKIFRIYGKFNIIRKELIKRNWIEKCSTKYLSSLKLLTNNELLVNCQPGNKYEQMLLSNLCNIYLCNSYPNFIWQAKIQNSVLINFPYRNIIKRSRSLSFTSKSGLIGCIENSHWYTIENISEINVPRVYRLPINDNNYEFLCDYCTTYCISLIKYLVETKIVNYKQLFSNEGTISNKLIYMAFKRIECEILYRQNEDLSEKSIGYEIFDDKEWLYFYEKINNVISNVEKFKTFKHTNEVIYCYNKSEDLLREAIIYKLTTRSEGYNNLWILKPAYSCRGNGIVIKRNVTEIMYFAKSLQRIPYIVQKYIEKPLLIYKTKFDIRIYMLLSITPQNVEIWVYKNCYLRFSSQEYEICELKKSVHLTNNAVQKKFKNGNRSEHLPSHNMWSLNDFQIYLNEHNLDNVWDEKIYPNIKKNIIAIVSSSLDETDFLKNSYQLYGCDFLLNENFTPILLEINANPDVSHSTIVTAKICPAVLIDLIKVIIDLPENINTDTGDFELIYSIDWTTTTNLNNIELEVIGKKIKSRNRPTTKNENCTSKKFSNTIYEITPEDGVQLEKNSDKRSCSKFRKVSKNKI